MNRLRTSVLIAFATLVALAAVWRGWAVVRTPFPSPEQDIVVRTERDLASVRAAIAQADRVGWVSAKPGDERAFLCLYALAPITVVPIAPLKPDAIPERVVGTGVPQGAEHQIAERFDLDVIERFGPEVVLFGRRRAR